MASCQPAVSSCHWRSRWPRSPITHPPHSCKPPHVRTSTPGHCALRHAAGARLLIPPSMLGWKCSPGKWLNSGPERIWAKECSGVIRGQRAEARATRNVAPGELNSYGRTGDLVGVYLAQVAWLLKSSGKARWPTSEENQYVGPHQI